MGKSREERGWTGEGEEEGREVRKGEVMERRREEGKRKLACIKDTFAINYSRNISPVNIVEIFTNFASRTEW